MKHADFDQILFDEARKDARYQALLAQRREAEDAYREIFEQLPPLQQEALEP